MTCPNCGQETTGIKLNGKLFCSFCGELIKDPAELLEESYEHARFDSGGTQSIPKESTSLPVDSEPDYQQKRYKKGPSFSVGKNSAGMIKKHQRPRTDAREFGLVTNEPDPISEPELEAPDNMLIEAKSAPAPVTPEVKDTKEANFSLLPYEYRKELKQNAKKKQDILTSYLKETSGMSKEGKKPSKKNKTRKKKNVFARVTITLIITLILAGVGMVYYVNNYVINTATTEKKLNKNASFIHKKPRGVPEGYQLSYLSKAGNNYILYRYDFKGDRDRYVSMKAEKTDLKSAAEVIDVLGPGINFAKYSYDGLEFWQVESGEVYVVADNVLYTFSQSGELFDEIILDFARETML